MVNHRKSTKHILLINHNYYDTIFSESKAKAAISRSTPPLGLLSIASPLIESGHAVKLIDLNLIAGDNQSVLQIIQAFKPDVVGINSTTPLIKKTYELAGIIKQYSKEIVVVAGGPHPSALPESVLLESEIDCVVKGEGELAFKQIVENGVTSDTPNIYYKENGQIVSSSIQEQFIEDLDALPYPAYELLDIEQYAQPLISSRKSPVGYLETSRGCYGRCTFCNKNIHGYKVRMKTPKRVVDEMEHMLELGFQEIHIIDDIFTANRKRVYAICEEILIRGLKFPWYPRGGVRVETVTQEMLEYMKQAGCYRVPFGVESGSQRIIDVVSKKIKLEQAERAVKFAKAAGLETECYFMLGLPTETEEDVKKSINFAIKLNPDYAKFAISIPLPGTRMFEQMLANGQIKSQNWDEYNFSTPPKNIYNHDVLSWDVLSKYYDISHRKFYFRPKYIMGMFFKTIAHGTFLGHVNAFFKTKW